MSGIEKFPFYKDLTEEQRGFCAARVQRRAFHRGEIIHRGDCAGLIFVENGRLRVYTVSEEGREITLYRLSSEDVCLLSASCMLTNIRFEVFVSAETECSVLLLPSDVYKNLSETSLSVASYTNALMAERFSGAMWVLSEVLGKKFDARLAALLLKEKSFAGGSRLKVTHEQLASHLGTVREAVSRMLKYFEGEGLVSLSRGGILLKDEDVLRRIAEGARG